IVFKYSFKQDILIASAIYSILIFIFQVVVHELFNFIINTEGFTSEQHFFTLTIVANFSIFFSCSIALINTYIQNLKNELLAIRSNSNLYDSFYSCYNLSKPLINDSEQKNGRSDSQREEAK